MGQWLDEWLQTKENKEYKTFMDYKLIVEKHLKPGLGDIPLSQLKPINIENYYTKKQKEGRADGKEGGLSNKTLAKHHRVLRMALQKAVANDLILYNPAERVSDVPKPDKEKVGKKLNINEVQELIRLTRTSDIGFIVQLALLTGLRLGEVLAMKWKYVDWDKHLYTVRETLQRQKIVDENGVLVSKLVYKPKPKSGVTRKVPLPMGIIMQLRQLRRKQAEDKLRAGELYEDHDLIHCQQDGTPWEPSNISNKFHSIIKNSNLPAIRFHDLRHTFVSNLIQDLKIDYKTASALAGHADPGFTLNTYSHSEFEYEMKAIQQLEDYYFNGFCGENTKKQLQNLKNG